MNTNQPVSRSILPWHLSWLTLILGILVVGTFLAIANPTVRYPYPVPMFGGGVVNNTTAVESAPPSAAGGGVMMKSGVSASPTYYPNPYQSPDVPVTDTREFLKVYYNATMRTRDVPTLTSRVETTVRGYSGRVDQESSSQLYGSVSFVVPQSKYLAFRAELESLVDSRFLTVNVSSQNLLPQKISIEEQQALATKTLADYRAYLQTILTTHTNLVRAIQTKIDADTAQLTALRAQPSTLQLSAQMQALIDDQTSLNQQLANENSSYASQVSTTNASIKYTQDWQKAIQTQDQTLIDNVATVSGTISIQWISLWEMARLYLPGYWIPAIFAVLTVLSYLWDRRRARNAKRTE